MNTCNGGGPETCTQTDADNIEPYAAGISSTWFTSSAPEIEIPGLTSKKSLLCGLRMQSFETSRGIHKMYAKWCNSEDTDPAEQKIAVVNSATQTSCQNDEL